MPPCPLIQTVPASRRAAISLALSRSADQTEAHRPVGWLFGQDLDRDFGQDGITATAANRPDGRAARWEKNSSAAVLVSMPMS
jgi:hypothetical protein